MTKIITKNVYETKKAAAKMAKIIAAAFKKQKPDSAIVVGLEGNLGGGKTAFVQGFAKGLGVKENVISPTFVILKKFKIAAANFNNLIHIDAYRLNSQKEILNLEWRELISDNRNIILVEWADKIRRVMPKEYLWIKFAVKNKNKREIEIRPTRDYSALDLSKVKLS